MPTKQKQKIVFTDLAVTGEEPNWNGADSWDVDQYMATYHRMFRFYNYYCHPKDLRKDLLKWVKDNGYDKETQNLVRTAPDAAFSMPAVSIAKSLNNGMPDGHPDAEDWLERHPGVSGFNAPSDFLRNELRRVIPMLKNNGGTDTDKKVERKSPIELLQEKVKNLMLPVIEAHLDDCIINSSNLGVIEFDIVDEFTKLELPPKAIPFVQERLAKELIDASDALEGIDPDLVEGYSFMSKAQLKKWVAHWKGLHDALDGLKERTKKVRKAQKVRNKTVPVTTQLKRLKYEAANADYDLQSINPETIIGANTLVTFNTKYRVLTIWRSMSGIQVKGTTLENVDLSDSFSIRLRKPEDVLPIIKKKNEKAILKKLDEVKSKRKPCSNSRINANTILLRVL